MTTSYILGRKLMTLKLDKSEFSKLKSLRKSILQEKHKIISSLQLVLSKQVTNKTCRLCLSTGGQKIFSADNETKVAILIKYLLGIEIKENDGKPEHICRKCESIVRAAAQLKQTAETTQWRLQQELELVNEVNVDFDEQVSKKPLAGGYFNVKGSTIVREWACRKCCKTFQSQEEYTVHEKLPSCRQKVKCCVCETCGREFKSLFLLKRHRLTHSERPGDFSCAYCPYRAHTKYAVTVHERWHTGDRPLRCSLCAKSFPNASNLWAHKRRHLPPTYHCDVCTKSFRFKQTLKDHIASQHSTERRFHCSSCGKAFATRKKELRHERRVHNRPRLRDLEKIYSDVTQKAQTLDNS